MCFRSACDLTVNQAGGYLIQLLPFASDSVIEIIENNIKGLPSVTQMFSDGMTAEDIALKVLEGLDPNVLDDFEVNYKCDCSKGRVEKALISIGQNDLLEMSKDEKTNVECHFCGKQYEFTSNEILELLQQNWRRKFKKKYAPKL